MDKPAKASILDQTRIYRDIIHIENLIEIKKIVHNTKSIHALDKSNATNLTALLLFFSDSKSCRLRS